MTHQWDDPMKVRLFWMKVTDISWISHCHVSDVLNSYFPAPNMVMFTPLFTFFCLRADCFCLRTFFILELTLPKTQKPGFCWRHSLTRGFLMNTEVNPGSWFPESIWKILGIFNQSDWECLQPTICYGVNEIAYLVAHPTARKWVITPVQNGISRDDPVITGVN